jgi:galactonate dehydratase
MDLALPNFGIQEISWAIHYNIGADLGTYLLVSLRYCSGHTAAVNELLLKQNPEVLDVVEGHIQAPMTPGLGIEINEKLVREMAAKQFVWSTPTWRGFDGGLREW